MIRLRRYAKVILGVYLALLAWALLAPTSDTQSGMVEWLGHLLSSLGAPAGMTRFSRLELVMNILIIAPVSLLGSMVWRRLMWRDWTAYGFVFSSAVEATQALLLSTRVAQFSDIVANTGGAFLGAVVVRVVSLAHSRRSTVAPASDER